MLRVTNDEKAMNLRLAHRWIASSYWSTGIPYETFARACANSLVFAAFEDDRQVGFARVVTDRSTFAWLCDVFVDESARGRGVASRLMEAIVSDTSLKGLRNVILATRDAHGFYEKFGFERVGDPDDRYMRIHRAPSEIYGPAGRFDESPDKRS